jgi:hypothetical protein
MTRLRFGFAIAAFCFLQAFCVAHAWADGSISEDGIGLSEDGIGLSE